MDSITNELKHIRSLEKHLYPKGFCFFKKKKQQKCMGEENFQKLKGPYAVFPLNWLTYEMFYQGKQILMDFLW